MARKHNKRYVCDFETSTPEFYEKDGFARVWAWAKVDIDNIDDFAVLILNLERKIIPSAIQRFVVRPLNDKPVKILTRTGVGDFEVNLVVRRVQPMQIAHRIPEEKEIP